MPFKKHGRQYDLVVFGATGYTGLRTAEHIAAHLPTDLKWALAGRSESKLQNVVARCKAANPDRIAPSTEICELNDKDLASLAPKTFAFITTVGPYSKYGEYAFKACAENGTHYFDVTGEIPWVWKMLAKYEKVAQASGAMMFPEIGIESAPPDLMTWSMAQVLRKQLSAKTGAVDVAIDLHSAPSGGTLATALGIFQHHSMSEVQASMTPYALSPVPNPKRAPSDTLLEKLFGVRQLPQIGTVTTSITASTDAAIVYRSWGLYNTVSSREKQAYGANFTYREFMTAKGWLHGVAMHVGLILGFLILAISPLRALVEKFVYQPGQGPDDESAKGDFVEYKGTAVPDAAAKSGQIAVSRSYYGGSMYILSGLFMAQGALTILEEDVELAGGIFTPSCLGQPFIDRLDKVGFKLEAKVING